MIKLIYAFLLFGLITASCATTEQVEDQPTETEETREPVSEDDSPDWYDHANRSFSDSTAFMGAGLAVASDSAAAYEESFKQATGYLNYSIDAYAEEIRNELADGSNGEQFNSREFVLSLRNAVKNLELSGSGVEIEVEHIEKEESVHQVYTKLRIGKESAIELLASAIKNDMFTRSLRDSSTR